MKKENVIITGSLRHTEEYARQLIYRTLVRLDTEVDIIAVKIETDGSPSVAAIGYRCAILAKTACGSTLRSETRDCDEILAVYRALDMLVSKIDPTKMIADPRGTTAPAQSAGSANRS